MKHVIPVRPVVLGGDDVTILVRADLALPFAAKLLLAIEVETANIADKTPHLSACAGVAIARAGQPFLMVNALAESLCSTAKKEAKKNDREAPYPSMLAFHIAQSTLQEEYNVILDREKTGPDGCLRITANPIEVIRLSQQPKTARPSWSALIELARALDVEPRGRGKLIELRDLLVAEGRSKMAHDYWRRFIKVLKSQNEQALVGIDKALKTLGVADLASLPIVEKHGPEHCYCPVPDALELIDLGSLGALK